MFGGGPLLPMVERRRGRLVGATIELGGEEDGGGVGGVFRLEEPPVEEEADLGCFVFFLFFFFLALLSFLFFSFLPFSSFPLSIASLRIFSRCLCLCAASSPPCLGDRDRTQPNAAGIREWTCSFLSCWSSQIAPFPSAGMSVCARVGPPCVCADSATDGQMDRQTDS